MSFPVGLDARHIDERGNVKVVAEKHSTPIAQDMDLVNTAYNFFLPLSNQQFIITGVVASADKDVGNDGTDIIIYEATSLTTTTVDKVILQLPLPKQTTIYLGGLDFEVTPGRWVNAKMDDDDVFMTIGGFYVDVPSE